MCSFENLYSDLDTSLNYLQEIEDSTRWKCSEQSGTIDDGIKILKREFGFLRIFLDLQIYTSECNTLDATQKVVSAVLRDAASYLRRVSHDCSPISVYYCISNVQISIFTAKLEMKYKYCLPNISSPSPAYKDCIATPEFVMGLVDNAVKSLSDLSVNSYNPRSLLFVPGPKKRIKEVSKELKFLNNFVCFVSSRCIVSEPEHAFFIHHVLVVAGHAAMVAWLYFPDPSNNNQDLASDEMNVLLSDLLENMFQHIQPCTRNIYIDVLHALKSIIQLGLHHTIQIEHAAEGGTGFVEILLHLLVELPTISNASPVVSLKDQISTIKEMINLLRDTVINRLVQDFEFHLQDIYPAIVDAGLQNFLLYDIEVEKEHLVAGDLYRALAFDFLCNIQQKKAEIYLIFRKSVQSNLPRIAGVGSFASTLHNLKEYFSCYSNELASVMSQLQIIQTELERFQPFLWAIAEQHDKLQYFAAGVTGKAYEVEYIVIDACIKKDVPDWCIVRWLLDIIEEIKLIMAEVARIQEIEVFDIVLHNNEETPKAHTSLPYDGTPSLKEEMVGFKDMIAELKGQVLRGSSNLDVISIVGMAGLGKTTLANKIYFDHSVVSHFDIRAQCCVSQVYNQKDLLLPILHDVIGETAELDSVAESELADKLRKLLFTKRYLILIDDVWETNAWDDIKLCFCNAHNGSRIILTTREYDVAFHAKHVSDPHLLRLFTDDESWMLLNNKVFYNESCPIVLRDVGQKIVKKCGGLPLSIVLIAGILAGLEKEEECWEQVAINLGSHVQAQSKDIIELSYQHLPYHLKPCFLYFGVFSEDEEIHVSKLTWLWIAEGFVKAQAEMLLEDAARHWLDNLIGKNLVMVSKKSSDGKIKTCRIHDLLLDYCKDKATTENFLQLMKGEGCIPQRHHTPCRLTLYSQGGNLSEWFSICSRMQSFQLREARKVELPSICLAPCTFNSFKFLRVLDLEFTVVDSLPKELTFLRYLAIRTVAEKMFSGDFWNLETLIVKGIGRHVSLPLTLWKMVKLRHLHIYKRAIFTWHNNPDFFDSQSKMDDLQTLSSACFSCVDDADTILEKTPNLRKLRCEVLSFDRSFPAFSNLTKLEMLKVSSGKKWTWVNQLKLPSNIKKLTLNNLHIHLNEVTTLPKLEVLKLLRVTILSNVWEVNDKQLLQLKFLKLESPSFSEWNVSDYAFPSLEQLVLERCQRLKAIPSQFGDISSLKSIEIRSCKESLVESAMVIRETQVEDYQNHDFDVFIDTRRQ